MKKKIISVGMAVVLTFGIFAGAMTLQAAETEETTETVTFEEAATEAMTAEEMQAAIREMQATIGSLASMIQTLMQSLRNNNVTAAAASQPAVSQSAAPQPAASQPASSRSARPPRPVNPPISQARAIEIAFAYAAANVSGEGRLDEASLDFEKGQWVWEVEIEFGSKREGNKQELEIYIDINTGEVLWSEWD